MPIIVLQSRLLGLVWPCCPSPWLPSLLRCQCHLLVRERKWSRVCFVQKDRSEFRVKSDEYVSDESEAPLHVFKVPESTYSLIQPRENLLWSCLITLTSSSCVSDSDVSAVWWPAPPPQEARSRWSPSTTPSSIWTTWWEDWLLVLIWVECEIRMEKFKSLCWRQKVNLNVSL